MQPDIDRETLFRHRWEMLEILNSIKSTDLATSYDLGPQKVADEGKWDPLFHLISGKSRLVKYYNLARMIGLPADLLILSILIQLSIYFAV